MEKELVKMDLAVQYKLYYVTVTKIEGLPEMSLIWNNYMKTSMAKSGKC